MTDTEYEKMLEDVLRDAYIDRQSKLAWDVAVMINQLPSKREKALFWDNFARDVQKFDKAIKDSV